MVIQWNLLSIPEEIIFFISEISNRKVRIQRHYPTHRYMKYCNDPVAVVVDIILTTRCEQNLH